MSDEQLPQDFRKCVDFHGHVCPGLAIGYAAVKHGMSMLGLEFSKDEEIVAVVENDSCAVDAIQVLLGCTFGKGNLVFRNWGKQVFTFMDRRTGRAARISFRGPVPGSQERRALREKIDAGTASPIDLNSLKLLRDKAVLDLIRPDSISLFDVKEIRAEFPSETVPVSTIGCAECGEPTVMERMVRKGDKLLCGGCALRKADPANA
jgi:formylmethanofuran dehydrogenase subunit E